MKKTQSKNKKNHKIHFMKKADSSVEEITVQGFYLQQTQRRTVTTYTCTCSEKDIFYNQPNMQGLSVDQYFKTTAKK